MYRYFCVVTGGEIPDEMLVSRPSVLLPETFEIYL